MNRTYLMHARRTAVALITAASVLCSSCAPRIETPGVSNEGILPVSTSNPYVGSNVFLAREMERSALLFNFVKSRGGPGAVELSEGFFSAPKLVLYYPREREVYSGELVAKGESHEWIVRGPYQIDRRDYRAIAGVEAAREGEPVFVLRGKTERFVKPESETPSIKVVTVVVTPTPTPKKPQIHAKPKVQRPVEVTQVQPSAPPTEAPLELPTDFKNLNSDQHALMMAKGFAERDQNGDLIHTVKGGSETLSAIVKWYTNSVTELQKIAGDNSVQSPNEPLPDGKRIVIPQPLVKQVKQMPAGFQ